MTKLPLILLAGLLGACRIHNNIHAFGVDTEPDPESTTSTGSTDGDNTDDGTGEDDGSGSSGGPDGGSSGGDGGASGGDGAGDGTGGTDEGTDDEDEVIVVEDDESGTTYAFSTRHMDWPQAQDWCAKQGMTLATINDADENALLHRLVWGETGSDGLLGNPAWIGYHNDGISWFWDSGEESTFENFSGDVITDDWGTATYGQSAAFADMDEATWQEAPGNWYYTAICETPAP